MQKFEKVPESQVLFNADVAVEVRSRVPDSDSPLIQCLAGEGWWRDGHMEKGIEISSTDLARQIK